MIVNKAGDQFKRWTHRIILENYERHGKSKPIDGQENDQPKNNLNQIIQFIGYNGPTVSFHATKKLLAPLLVFQNESFNNDFDEYSQNEFKENFLDLTFNVLSKQMPTILENFTDEAISYNLICKLGVAYFSGKSVNLKLNYTLNDVFNLIDRKKVDNVQKGASLNASFNSNKGIADQIEFENFLRRNKFKFVAKKKFYSMKMYDTHKRIDYNLQLDENFHLTSVTSEKEKNFNIDYLRDRRKSFDKTTGTFIDIFDLRFQFSSDNKIKRDEVYDLLLISNKTENILNELVKLSDNGQDLIVNKNIGIKFRFFRESEIRIFSIPSKNEQADTRLDFQRHFTVNISKVTEYIKKGHDSCYEEEKLDDEEYVQDNRADQSQNKIDELVLEKNLIANSTVYCSFDLNQWLHLWNRQNFDETFFRELLANIGLYLFNQILAFSNEIFKINNLFISKNTNTKSSDQNSNGWLLDLIETKSNRIKHISTVKFSFQNQLVDNENFSFLKKIVYSKNYLEIFDLNLKTAAELEDGDLDSLYKNIAQKLSFYVGNSQSDENPNLLVNGKESKLVRIAIHKLDDSYKVLNNKGKRENYLKNLGSLRKYRK